VTGNRDVGHPRIAPGHLQSGVIVPLLVRVPEAHTTEVGDPDRTAVIVAKAMWCTGLRNVVTMMEDKFFTDAAKKLGL